MVALMAACLPVQASAQGFFGIVQAYQAGQQARMEHEIAQQQAEQLRLQNQMMRQEMERQAAQDRREQEERYRAARNWPLIVGNRGAKGEKNKPQQTGRQLSNTLCRM